MGLWSQEKLGWMLTTSAQRWPERELVKFEEERYSYRDVWRWVTYLANSFTQCGIGPNSRVLIQLGNCMELVVSQLACWRIGAICVPVIPIYRAHEVAHILRDSVPDVVIAAAVAGVREPYREMDRLLTDLDQNPIKILVGANTGYAGWKRLADRPADDVAVDETCLPDPASADTCLLILYTSGTTSAPKGVRLTSRALVSNFESWHRTVGLSYADVFCSGSPLGHIAALGSALLMPMRIGARTVLMSSWDPDRAVVLIEQEKVTYMSGAAVFIYDLVQRYASGASPSHRVQLFYSGGSPTPPELVEQADALGVRVVRCYGMTETAGTTTTAWRNTPLDRRANYDGKVEFGTEMQAVDDDRVPLPAGQVGHIRIRSPKMMLGYTDPDITAAQLDADGWFYPGDLGSVDADGWFRMAGRTKDIINRGGEKFSAVDIERALLTFSGIRQAAVVGVRDDRFGEVVAAFLTLQEGHVWQGPDAVLAHLESIKLAKAKFPVHWRILDEIPTSATGKVIKQKLIQIFEECGNASSLRHGKT
jgi:acyl-CoA synthetase (AMP-forming)/AMP-acid ligase II